MSRPGLHLFSLPIELLNTLTPRNVLSQQRKDSEGGTSKEIDVEPAQTESEKSRTCNICPGAVFANGDVEGHRSHFRTDWHRYNVKAKLSNGKLASEREFQLLVEGLEDSLSGSASSSSEDESDSDSDAVQRLLQKTRIQPRSSSPTSVAAAPLTPISWFHSPPAFQLGVYRAIFRQNSQPQSCLDELRTAQTPVPGGRKWTMFMVAGGHFAGLVARVSKPSDLSEGEVRKGKQKMEIPEVEIIMHKTFHRYTTRRKQGGSQSLNDNAKGNAKSAGATLRRYGEQALRDDIRNLIAEWADEINESERIWIRASAANRRIFMDYEEAIISKGDERLRTFPFPTRRPTQAELSRCLLELTRVKTTHFTEAELQAQDEEYLASLPKPKPAPTPAPLSSKAVEKKPIPPKLTKEEEAFRDKWLRFIDMIKKGRLEPAKSFWEREGQALAESNIDSPIPEWSEERTGTLLQLATSAGQAEIVSWLLDEMNADPTIPVPSTVPKTEFGNQSSMPDGVHEEDFRPTTPNPTITSRVAGSNRTAYDLTPTRAVRDVFRRSAGLRPDAYDWLGAAHIPSILHEEVEDKRKEKQKERRKGLRDKIREREKEAKEKAALEEEAEKEKKWGMGKTEEAAGGRFASSGPQRLGGAASVGNANVGLAGISPEMRAKIERERRARAAEQRLRGK